MMRLEKADSDFEYMKDIHPQSSAMALSQGFGWAVEVKLKDSFQRWRICLC
jgi:hypothetical protein